MVNRETMVCNRRLLVEASAVGDTDSRERETRKHRGIQAWAETEKHGETWRY